MTAPPGTRRGPVPATGTGPNRHAAKLSVTAESTEHHRRDRRGTRGDLYVAAAGQLVLSSSGKTAFRGVYRCPACRCWHAWQAGELTDRLRRRTSCDRTRVVLLVTDAT